MIDKLWANGIYASDLYDAFSQIVTAFNATLAKLDADSGVTATNYVSTCAMTLNAGFKQMALEQGRIVDMLEHIRVKIAAVTAKLDADSLTDSNYASTIDITDVIDSSSYSARNISQIGMRQGDLISILSTIKTNINALQVKLDADATVNTNTYDNDAITFGIDTTGA